MTRTIGILETGEPSEDVAAQYGTYPQMFRDFFSGCADLDFSVVPVANNIALPKPSDCAGWIITGSSAGVYEDHPWIAPLKDFIRQSAAQSTPMLGICFGHQLMAEAFGGKVVKSSKGRGLGIHTYSLNEAGQKIFPGGPSLSLVSVHQDQVVQAPKNAKLLASSDFCTYAAFAYGTLGLSLQAHPEFTPESASAMIANWQAEAPIDPKIYETAQQSLTNVRPDTRRTAMALHRFLAGHTL